MIVCIADNISTPLGWNTEENLAAVRSSHSALARYDDKWSPVSPFVASLFEDTAIEQHFTALNPKLATTSYTRFEQLLICSVAEAQSACGIDLAATDVLFIVATTKGNIELLCNPTVDEKRTYLSTSAEVVAQFFGNTNPPIVVSNACISGAHAQLVAKRFLDAGKYRYAVVCGGDLQSQFIVSGFQSFKALDDAPCRPFDASRKGLNLGDGAATMILEHTTSTPPQKKWILAAGAVANDAHHISAPSRTGEGSFRALQAVRPESLDSLACINLHGTGTLYNDEMEAVVIRRAEALHLPINSYKGYFGHTMGAAGLLETILTQHALDHGIILPTPGFQNLGVSEPLDIVTTERPTSRKAFIKLISGFGGCNAALYWTKDPPPTPQQKKSQSLTALHHIFLTPQELRIDQSTVPLQNVGASLLVDLYRKYVGNYPRFYKMDGLSRLGFLATELLVAAGTDILTPERRERAAVVFVSRYGSLATDQKHWDTIRHAEAYYPSPAVFVYTLPNIVTGELAIRHHIQGETAAYLLAEKDPTTITELLAQTLKNDDNSFLLGGWLDYHNDTDFEADITLYAQQ